MHQCCAFKQGREPTDSQVQLWSLNSLSLGFPTARSILRWTLSGDWSWRGRSSLTYDLSLANRSTSKVR